MKTQGWNDTHEKLYRMSIDGKWNQMGDEITDEMLDSFAVIGTYDQIAGKIKSTYGKYATSVSFGMDTQNEEEENILRDVIKNLKGS